MSATMRLRLDDRITTVLERDARMLDVLVAASPAFEKLRNPLLRRTISKLATIEQAARVAGIDAEDLLTRLNRVLDGAPIEIAPIPLAGGGAQGRAADPLPAIVLATPPERVVDCDVREDLRAGREPFQRILAAARHVPDDGLLCLRAIFEPAPLYAVLGRQGLAHFTEKLAEDDWRVWFWRDRATRLAAEPAQETSPEDPELVVVDVRGLEPPEPMVRTLEALERLPRGKTLVQINVRVPQFLIPQLAARGFVHEVREQSADLVRIFIRHATSQGEP